MESPTLASQPPPVPYDVRTHLLRGVFRGEVRDKTEFFRAHGLDIGRQPGEPCILAHIEKSLSSMPDSLCASMSIVDPQIGLHRMLPGNSGIEGQAITHFGVATHPTYSDESHRLVVPHPVPWTSTGRVLRCPHQVP